MIKISTHILQKWNQSATPVQHYRAWKYRFFSIFLVYFRIKVADINCALTAKLNLLLLVLKIFLMFIEVEQKKKK